MDRKLSLKLSALSFSTITSLTCENTTRAKNAHILGMNIDYAPTSYKRCPFSDHIARGW